MVARDDVAEGEGVVAVGEGASVGEDVPGFEGGFGAGAVLAAVDDGAFVDAGAAEFNVEALEGQLGGNDVEFELARHEEAG